MRSTLPTIRQSLKRSHLQRGSPIPSRVAAFSAWNPLREEAKEKTSTPSQAQPNREQHEEEYSGKQKPRSRIRIPANVIAALGFPTGWFLSEYYRHRGDAQVSSRSNFVKYTVVGKETVSSTCTLFKVEPSTKSTIDAADPSLDRSITSIEFKQPQLQIARAYTCLPPNPNSGLEELRFLIRKERNGEVSGYLHRLPEAAEVEVRGPAVEYNIPENVKSVAFLAGGTGIVPALQVADILSDEADIHILWANRRREDCVGGLSDTPSGTSSLGWWSGSKTDPSKGAARLPSGIGNDLSVAAKGAIVAELEGLKRQYASRLSVDYFVDEEETLIRPEAVKAVLANLSRPATTGGLPSKILFVSGPPGFVSHWAGPKQWQNGQEVQGPIGGTLSTMDLREWTIVKL